MAVVLVCWSSTSSDVSDEGGLASGPTRLDVYQIILCKVISRDGIFTCIILQVFLNERLLVDCTRFDREYRGEGSLARDGAEE